MNSENREERIQLVCLATARGNALAYSKTKGTPSIDVQFTIDKIGDDIPPGAILKVGTVLTWNGWLTEGAFERTMKTVERCFGWRGTNFEEINQNAELFAGKQVQLVINFEPGMNDRNKLFPKVAFVNRIPQLQSLPAEDAAKIADDFRDKLMEFRASQNDSGTTLGDLAEGSLPAAKDSGLPF